MILFEHGRHGTFFIFSASSVFHFFIEKKIVKQQELVGTENNWYPPKSEN
jgi:hypothetical protein